MQLVAPAMKNTAFNVAVTYGTKKRASEYLGFKSFGRFVENPEFFPTCLLSVDPKYDTLVRPQPKADTAIKAEIEADMSEATEPTDSPAWLTDDND
jgi:hypothetical protein